MRKILKETIGNREEKNKKGKEFLKGLMDEKEK
jgi:hypothetical protein